MYCLVRRGKRDGTFPKGKVGLSLSGLIWSGSFVSESVTRVKEGAMGEERDETRVPEQD